MIRYIVKRLKSSLSRVPVLGNAVFNSAKYWESRYLSSGNSGAGSYGYLAEFKADVLNDFIKKHGIESVIEFGCGDGHQLKLANYPNYIGYDISPKSVQICQKLFINDPNKAFNLVSEWNGNFASLSLSLDVIYHLVENDVFHRYMQRLFQSSVQWVIIYSSNTEKNSIDQALHVRHRKFTEWVRRYQPGWCLYQHIPNKYSLTCGQNGSFADFYIYRKVN